MDNIDKNAFKKEWVGTYERKLFTTTDGTSTTTTDGTSTTTTDGTSTTTTDGTPTTTTDGTSTTTTTSSSTPPKPCAIAYDYFSDMVSISAAIFSLINFIYTV
jgi:hypothetical protein